MTPPDPAPLKALAEAVKLPMHRLRHTLAVLAEEHRHTVHLLEPARWTPAAGSMLR